MENPFQSPVQVGDEFDNLPPDHSALGITSFLMSIIGLLGFGAGMYFMISVPINKVAPGQQPTPEESEEIYRKVEMQA